jgi:ribonuclease-3
VESVIAACYLDGGMTAAVEFIQKFILVNVPVTKLHNADYKTALQELVQQKKNQVLSYKLVGESGPDHDKEFRVELTLNGEMVGTGIGSSKKRAEQAAAQEALELLYPNT